MRKPLSDEQRIELRKRWSQFVRGLLKGLKWNASELANYCGCTRACVTHWVCEDPERGTIPNGISQKRLVDLAREHGLVD